MSSEQQPPVKKTKYITTSIYMQFIDNYIKSITSSEENLQPIIGEEFHQPLKLIKVFAGHIRDVKDISKAILILNQKIPLKELPHLKRARRQDIILCPTTFLQNMSSIQEYIESHVTELKDVFDYFKEIDVPMLPPKVTKQYTEVNKIWSCNFHPNHYFEKLVSNNFFTSYELKLHRKFMVLVFEVAKWFGVRNEETFDVEDMFTIVNVTVVVDPSYNKIVTIAYDYRDDHPMQHTAMVAIDNVAKTQNGGVWSTQCNDSSLPGIEKELGQYLKTNFSQFIIGFKMSKENPNLLGDKGDPKTDSQGAIKEKDGPYLCTGYYIYMLREPCVMCSMALVHARAKRVFFCFDNSDCGALNSVAKLQNISSLNHHFEVFTGFL